MPLYLIIFFLVTSPAYIGFGWEGFILLLLSLIPIGIIQTNLEGRDQIAKNVADRKEGLTPVDQARVLSLKNELAHLRTKAST